MDPIDQHPLYRRHTIDTALNAVGQFYRQNFIMLFAISLVMSVAVQLITGLVNLNEFQSTTDPMEMLEKMKEMIVPLLIISLVSLLFNTILQHYIIFKPLDQENTVFVSVYKSLRYFFPYLILMVLLAFFGVIAVAFGFLALIIGAFFAVFYIMTLYIFVLPIMLLEKTSIGETISRTMKLAHTNFWTNFGWVAVFVILLVVLSVILSAVIMIPFAGNFIKSLSDPDTLAKAEYIKNPFFIILTVLIGALTMPLMPIFACTMYFNARAGETNIPQPEPVTEYRPTVEDLYAKPRQDDQADQKE